MDTFGVEILDGLGTAEMWHIFLTNHPGDVRVGTLGKPVAGFDVRVRDDHGHDVPTGEVGWLWVRGDSRAQQYWHQSAKSYQAFRGAWYASGDMVRQDEDGYFHYCGRGDDMLKVSGKWLAPKELENCLLQHPRVQEVAVVGVPDAAGLAKPCAFVIAADAAETCDLESELQAYARARLEAYKYPRTVVIMDDLPRTHLGKVDRGKLRALLAS
jgi:acyl-coenzyme A synthetase/AMP-(fatty) acid ligase